MRHQTVRQSMYEFLRNELPASQRREIERHLESCQQCAQELESLRSTVDALTSKLTRPSAQRSELYWQQFAEKVERRIESEIPADESQSFVERLLDLLVENRKPFSYGFASALSLIVVAFAVWSLWIRNPAIPESGVDEAAHTAPPTTGVVHKTAMELRAEEYLEQSKVLLIGIMNTDAKSLVGSKAMLDRQRTVSRSLIRESQDISAGLTDPSQQRLKELVNDLGLILVQIANLETEHGVQGVEIVRGGVERNGILFKINLEEIQSSSAPSSGKSVDKHAKSNI